MGKILELDKSERPRERLAAKGPKSLSDQELLAILLGSGNKNCDVLAVASGVLSVVDQKNGALNFDDLLTVKGVGTAKACLISAAIEFARRRIAPDGIKIKAAQDVIPIIQHLLDRKQETFVCISLNGAHEVIASRIVTVGLANLCQVHPREVLADPLVDRACSVIVAHNHPSGELTPSEEDQRITVRLKEASKLMGINFLDHIIFSKRGYYSFQEGKARSLFFKRGTEIV